ncbi:hypothetical protein BVC80_8753g15 [Macleaya cordata]|uniref:Reverse transcriptase zinc-binding domain n=1 Tax=Macleaya cordata TaxID=56857 RepID=A0A200QKL9_MACCD|nr:hypothetical protein BVC80_8753g15 [Macleaya cordata]
MEPVFSGNLGFIFNKKLQHIRDKLKVWNHEVFGRVDRKLDDLLSKIKEVDEEEENAPNNLQHCIDRVSFQKEKPYGTGLWRGVCNNHEVFSKGIRYEVAKGDRVLFWKDTWLGEEPLNARFPNLFMHSRHQDAYVNHFFLTGNDGVVVWDLGLRHRLPLLVRREADELQQLLSGFTFADGEDGRVWRWEKNGQFTVSSCYSSIHVGGFGIDWSCGAEVKGVFFERKQECFSDMGNLLWSFLPFAICWVLWIERNDRVFNGNEKDRWKILLDIKSLLYYWASPTKILNGVHFADLVFNWESIVRKM